jgi:hypothetical protein
LGFVEQPSSKRQHQERQLLLLHQERQLLLQQNVSVQAAALSTTTR